MQYTNLQGFMQTHAFLRTTVPTARQRYRVAGKRLAEYSARLNLVRYLQYPLPQKLEIAVHFLPAGTTFRYLLGLGSSRRNAVPDTGKSRSQFLLGAVVRGLCSAFVRKRSKPSEEDCATWCICVCIHARVSSWVTPPNVALMTKCDLLFCYPRISDAGFVQFRTQRFIPRIEPWGRSRDM